MEQNDFIAVEAQRGGGIDDHIRVLPEIGDDGHQSPAVQELLEVQKRFREIRARAEFRFLDPVQQTVQLSLTSGRRDVVVYVLMKYDETRRIALVVRHVSNGRRQKLRIIELGDAMRAKSHGFAGVEQHRDLAIRLAAIAL